MSTTKSVPPSPALVATAMLSAVALVLMLLEFPLLPAAPYLKMDFSDIPAVLAGVLFDRFTAC